MGELWVLIAYVQKPHLNSQVLSVERDLKFGLSPHLHPYFMYVSCEGSGEWHMCMLSNAIRNQILVLVFFTNIQMNTVITFMIRNGNLIT